MSATLEPVISLEEHEEMRGSGVGVVTSDGRQGELAYRQQLMQTIIRAATIQLAGLSGRDLAKVSTEQLSKAFASLGNDTTARLEAKLAKIGEEHGPELVALAMKDVGFKLRRGADGKLIVDRDDDPTLVTPYGKYITREEVESWRQAA